MEETNKKLDDILEIVTFIKDNAAMQSDMDARFDELRSDMDARFDEVKSELSAIRTDISDIKQRLTALEKRTLEDANVAAQDILELRQRVDELERKLTILEHAHQPA
ncbi:MAG: hypothetical protein AAB633_00645 [Patescibacteria group bacterium]